MLVSHESPISILDASQSYNDYDYALVHLFETHPEYYKFFKRSLAAGREVLLDNSISELGESFDPNKYRKDAEELNPTFYIVPDVLEDSAGTIRSWLQFLLNGTPEVDALKIGVVQGNSYKSSLTVISLCLIMQIILLSLLTIDGIIVYVFLIDLGG